MRRLTAFKQLGNGPGVATPQPTSKPRERNKHITPKQAGKALAELDPYLVEKIQQHFQKRYKQTKRMIAMTTESGGDWQAAARSEKQETHDDGMGRDTIWSESTSDNQPSIY